MIVKDKMIICLSICEVCPKQFNCQIEVNQLIYCINSYEDKFYGKSMIKSENFLEFKD
jgi:hypothetical protein